MKFNVGITGTGSLIGQGVIKSIINTKYAENYKLIGFDYFKNTVGSFWCGSNYILPDILKPDVTEQQWLNSLTDIIRAEKIDILFIGVDFELPILARVKADIEKNTGCKVMVSSEEVIKIANDKYLTYKFLKDNGLNYPITYLPEEVNEDKLVYPLIIKPRVGARSVGVYKVNSPQELLDKLKLVNNPIIQEYLGTDDTEYTCGTIFLNDELKAQISLKRSLKEGNTFISECNFQTPKSIHEYVEEVALKLKPYGACNIQLRIDKNNIPKLFEINPRHSGTTFMRTLFGYSEVIYILKFLLENKVIPFSIKEGKAMRFYNETLI